MLQSSNQYLRPEYLTAPSALDNKSSPLALLAQTCSAIGADTTNPKLLAANIEKSTKSLKSLAGDVRDKSSPVSSHSSSVSTGSVEHQQVKSSFKPYETNNSHIRERSDAEVERATNLTNNQSSQRVKTPKTNVIQQNGHQHLQTHPHQQTQPTGQMRCDSNQSATSQRDSPATSTATPTPTPTNGLQRVPSTNVIDLQHHLNSSQRASSKEQLPMTTTTISQASPSNSTTRLQAASDAAIAAAKEASYVKALHAAAAAAGIPTSTTNGASTANPYYTNYVNSTSGMPYTMDLITASALMSPHHPMFKAAALNPYINYARMKGIDPATASAMMPPNVCRDPYCTGCPSSPHYLNKAAGQPCPVGCPQCEGSQAGKPPSASSSSAAAASAAAAAAASSYHAQLAALAAASQMPYVCSWIGSDAAYCGKRFGTSDELFQHLRTHTASMPDSVLSAAAAGGIPPNHPLFQRTYPTPPLSPLSAARYHPYGKPPMLPPALGPPPASLASLQLAPHHTLAQYFNPYSIYGSRMGSSHP
ncbi:zinc finger protein Elbow [Teleopsis dalmanni]|uniref:zinc finger protein Elbow n=1 Tax=Teleopsis dalmanni TaxID=139649 RepID=UPI0018CCDFE9|nr:zinc finger protein Elbow [Teleopsis dalmanni]